MGMVVMMIVNRGWIGINDQAVIFYLFSHHFSHHHPSPLLKEIFIRLVVIEHKTVLHSSIRE